MLQSDAEYAGFWVRTGACLIDTFIMLVAMLPLMWLFYHGDWDLIFDTGMSQRDPVLWFDIAVNYIFPFAYAFIFWMLWSASPGKLLLGIKIVDASTGKKIKPMQAVIRYIGYFPATLILMIGIFWVAFDKRKQGWHDKMANTVVIRSND